MLPKLKTLTPLILTVTMLVGCDDRASQIAREAADRQAQQNRSMAELNKEVASSTHRLVEADAQARKEIVGVHRDIQAERSRLDDSWNSLNKERQQIAADRRTESMIVPVTKLIGGILLVGLVLGFCWYALVLSRSSDNADVALNEILVCELVPEELAMLTDHEHHGSLTKASGPPDELEK